MVPVKLLISQRCGFKLRKYIRLSSPRLIVGKRKTRQSDLIA